VPPQFVAADQLPLVEAPWPVHVLVAACALGASDDINAMNESRAKE
jgi:hypothetical protein